MPIKILSAAISGIDAQPIEVEVDSSPGIFAFNIVGLANKSVDESKDRIGSAIKNTGFIPPKSKNRKITVNLAPADVKKEGPAYDLPIALGYLMETEQVKFETSRRMFAGELSLDGTLKKTSGILAIAMLAQKLGLKEVIIPKANVLEAATVEGIEVIGADNLSQVLGHLDRTNPITPAQKVDILSFSETKEADHFSSIIGQEYAKRALIVAAAGGHNILMSGPPGSGKTILAKALSDILPSLSQEEAVEVAKIYSSLGISRRKNSPFSLQRPFRNPHHTTSSAAIVGGGSSPRPGEITLAHRGVLFFDELPEYHRDVLEALRQPLENGSVTVSRASGAIDLPAKFMFVGAMNPCPCGNYGEERLECSCLPYSVLKYRKRVSGPLLDRMDIQVTVSRETIRNSQERKQNSQIKEVRDRISRARAMQAERFKGLVIFTNSEIDFKSIDNLCVMDDEARELAKKIANQNNLSFRGYHRIIKVARTIADLEEAEVIKKQHVAEAIALRINDSMFENLA